MMTGEWLYYHELIFDVYKGIVHSSLDSFPYIHKSKCNIDLPYKMKGYTRIALFYYWKR